MGPSADWVSIEESDVETSVSKMGTRKEGETWSRRRKEDTVSCVPRKSFESVRHQRPARKLAGQRYSPRRHKELRKQKKGAESQAEVTCSEEKVTIFGALDYWASAKLKTKPAECAITNVASFSLVP